MRNDVLLLSSKRLFFSAIVASSILGGNASPVFSEGYGLNVVMQVNTISGIVADIHGEPIIGATVMVKGSNNGTITDIDGRFELSGATGTLVVSYIGYGTQEIKIGSKKSFHIVLQEDSKNLDEVVVVGYGTQKNRI